MAKLNQNEVDFIANIADNGLDYAVRHSGYAQDTQDPTLSKLTQDYIAARDALADWTRNNLKAAAKQDDEVADVQDLVKFQLTE